MLLISVLPGVELRGAVPLGVSLGMSPFEAFLISYLGSLLPAFPAMVLIRPLVQACYNSPKFRRFGGWLVRRSLGHGRQVQRYSALGLFLFVALPLPSTGVWTGAMIAGLLNMRARVALPAIAAGNLIAGTIVTFLSHQLI